MSPKLEKSEKMKRKKLDEAGNDESTMLNNQFSTVSKRLTPNRKMTLDRPRPSRYSRRLVEKGKTLLPACLEPPLLRGHCPASSAATHAIQQHDIPHFVPKQTGIVENSTVRVLGGIEVEHEAECSPPACSLKLTEIVALGGNDDDSETQSWAEDNDNEYEVKPEYMGILRKIIAKHGDIAKDCKVKTVKYRSMMMENICEVISALDSQNVRNLKGVGQMIDQINDAKVMEVKVDWLLKKLNEILEARHVLKESSKLKEKTDNMAGFIEAAKRELEKCEHDKKELSRKLKATCDREADFKGRLARMQEESIITAQKVKDATSKIKRFLNCSLIDGLI